MRSVDFELNIDGLRELMQSDGMRSSLEEAGQAVAAAAGIGYGTRLHEGSYVAICNVFPDSEEAAKDNYENNTLLKAVGASGLPQSKG